MLRPVHLAIGLIAVSAVTVVACGRFQREQRAEWRGQAERACMRTGAVKESQHVRIARALEGPGSCGADIPLKVSAFAMDTAGITASAPGIGDPFGSLLTRLNQEGTLNCPMYTAVDRWLEQVVQPAAMARFGQPVVELRLMGTYACRPMNNQRGNRLSEHSFANAIDIGGFRLADGSLITVLRGWKGGEQEQYFLREIHAGACQNFATVLGPGADAFHYDHFHFDLARHGRGGNRSICRPFPQAVPPPNEGFPVDPAKNMQMSRRALPAESQAYAFAAPRPPAPVGAAPLMERNASLQGYRPAQLPTAPRNPIAEREEAEFRMAPPRSAPVARPPNAGSTGAPIMLYGKGRGPFLPLPESEIDPEFLDPITGSIGE